MRLYNRLLGKKHLSAQPVSMADLSIAGTDGQVLLRVYTPTAITHPLPIVFVHGFVVEGNKNEFLNAVAEALAKMGFVVSIPNLPAESKYEMQVSDLSIIEDAIRWTANDTGQKVSVFGISFGGGLCIPAALNPKVVGDVKLIFSLAGYNDLSTIGRYYSHNRVTAPDGTPYPGDPQGALLFAYPYLDDLVPSRDLPAIRLGLNRLRRDQGIRLPGDVPVGPQLTDDQKEELTNLELVDTPKIHQLYIKMLAHHREELLAMSPSTVLSHLSVPLFILHGEDDPVFPIGEVDWMRVELAGNPNAHILVTPWFGHATIAQHVGVWQKFRVICFSAEVLHDASSPAPLSR